MLQKLVVFIGSVFLAGVALAEDAPLPFDEPAAASPIVRKANPTKTMAAPAVLSSKALAKGRASKYSRHANKKFTPAKSASIKAKAGVRSSKAAKPAAKNTRPAQSRSNSKKRR